MTELSMPSLLTSDAPTGVEAARLQAEAAFAIASRRKAVLVVAGLSTDAAECRTLLEMLGMSDEDLRAAQAAQAEHRRSAA